VVHETHSPVRRLCCNLVVITGDAFATIHTGIPSKGLPQKYLPLAIASGTVTQHCCCTCMSSMKAPVWRLPFRGTTITGASGYLTFFVHWIDVVPHQSRLQPGTMHSPLHLSTTMTQLGLSCNTPPRGLLLLWVMPLQRGLANDVSERSLSCKEANIYALCPQILCERIGR
jgi:hypothetical protein